MTPKKLSFSVTNKHWSFARQNCHGLLPFYEKNCHVQVYVLKNGAKKEEVMAICISTVQKVAITMKFIKKQKVAMK